MKIIYINDEGGVSVIHPTKEAIDLYGIEAIAVKDVPAGKPYKIIQESDIPDRTQRNAWAINPAELTDGVGGDSDQFPEAA